MIPADQETLACQVLKKSCMMAGNEGVVAIRNLHLNA